MKSLNLFWIHLLNAKNKIISNNPNLESLYYSLLNGFSIESGKNDLFKITFKESGEYQNIINLFNNNLFLEFNEVPKELLPFIRLYIPLLMANKLQPLRPFIMSHFAQSLDGKICTPTGKSKWISNEENLNHSHRLRAMVDAVMVGGGTIKADKPNLTVRRVEGKNPKRLFWCNSLDDYTPYKVAETFTILIANKDKIKSKPQGIDHFISYTNNHNPIPEVLTKLKNYGINSIFIEGGSNTLSNFHEAHLIDLIQIHIAPIIFGSGKSAFEMPPIDEVSDSLHLDGFFSTSEGHILYHGKPIYKD